MVQIDAAIGVNHTFIVLKDALNVLHAILTQSDQEVVVKFDLVFEGGGSKGIVFTGALDTFLSGGHEYGRLMGTSAGAIMATFLAAGYGPDEMFDALQEEKDGKPIFVTFLGTPGEFDAGTIQDSAILEWLRAVNIPGVPERIEEWVKNKLIRALLRSEVFRHLFSFVERGGLYTADAFIAWLHRKLNTGMYDGRPRQFGDMTLKQFFDDTETDLTLIAADVTDNRLLVLNHRTAPDCPVVWAVRMSMSFPLLWQEVLWQDDWGQYRGRSITGNAVVDGGMLSNFPIELFISQSWTEVMGPQQSQQLIGCLIDEHLEVPNAPPRTDSESDRFLDGLRTVKRIRGLIDTATQAHDKDVIDIYKHLVIRFPAKGYETIEFDMSDARREALVNAGRQAMGQHLDALSDQPPVAPRGLEFSGFYKSADEVAARILGE